MNADEVKALQLRVEASVELARRDLKSLMGDVEQFRTRADSSLSAVDASFGKLSGTIGLIKGGLAGVVASLGVQSFVGAGRAILQFADDLDAAATQANINVERYQTLRESLRVLEVDAEKADKIFKTLSDTLGAVQSGTAAEGAIKALDRMGVYTRILSGEITTTDGLLDAIAESATRFGTAAQFTSAVVDLVGRKIGVDLAAALRDGGKALKENEQNFRDAGGVVTDEYVQRLADANEAIDRFVSNSKSRLTIWAGETIGFFQEVGDRAEPVIQRILSATDRALGVKASPPKVDKAKQREAQMAADQRALAALSPDTDAYNRLYSRYIDAYGEAPTITVVGRRKIAPPDKAAPGGGRVSPKRPAPRQFSPNEIRMGLDRPDEKLPAVLEEAIPLFDKIDERLGSVGDNFSAIAATVTDISQVEIIDIDALEDARDIAQGFTRDLSYGIADVLTGSAKIGDVLVVSFKRAAAALIESRIFDLLGGNSGGGFVNNVFGALIGGRSFGGFFANGGTLGAGKWGIAGERGPEPIIGPATVIPNHALGGFSGGLVLNVDARGASDPAMIEAAARRGAMMGLSEAGNAARRMSRPKLRGGLG